MSAALPFPSERFLRDARHKSSLPPVLTQSDYGLQVLASPVIQVVSQPCDLESPTFPPSAVATLSPSATDGLKSKGRRRDPNHVPRPLNSFFLFKADWLAKRKSLLAGIEQDHRQLNRMASSEWKGLPQEVKQRFKDAAHSAKVEHATKYPEYRFTPKPRGDRRRRKTRRNEPEVLLRNEEAARLVSQGITGDALLEALADYDRRATLERRRPFSRAVSPPFPEAFPYTVPASSSVTPPFPLSWCVFIPRLSSAADICTFRSYGPTRYPHGRLTPRTPSCVPATRIRCGRHSSYTSSRSLLPSL